jgi:DNA (cytosine-5)-methyltransferase 1
MSARWRNKGTKADTHTDLLTPTLKRFRRGGANWIVENVPGAKRIMRSPTKLHGGMFGLGIHRPRLFETSFLVLAPKALQTPEPVGVYGNRPAGRTLWRRYRNNGNWRTAKNPKKSLLRAPRSLREAQEAMGIDWMTWNEIKEAVPPAYSEFIARQLSDLRG